MSPRIQITQQIVPNPTLAFNSRLVPHALRNVPRVSPLTPHTSCHTPRASRLMVPHASSRLAMPGRDARNVHRLLFLLRALGLHLLRHAAAAVLLSLSARTYARARVRIPNFRERSACAVSSGVRRMPPPVAPPVRVLAASPFLPARCPRLPLIPIAHAPPASALLA